MSNQDYRAGSVRGDGRHGLIFTAVVLGLLLSSVTILTASRAAFSDTTDNDGNYVTVGDVVLTDDDSTAALFELDSLAPGDSDSNCILVTYSGSIPDPGVVLIYSGGFTDSDALADDLNLTIEEGSSASFDDCSTFAADGTIFTDTLTAFDTTHTDYASGAGTWDPASTPESKAYRITIELDSDAATTSQGDSVTDLVFVWEVQS